MRIVQTFWTAGRNPLEYSFGWLHPEYNLMSWSLSCLSLREHYDEVALYTDTRGKEVLIDLLHLPYTEVHVVFDEFPCLPQHWALSKIKTYSLQDKPFLHIDGDVFLPKPIDPAILDAPLVAQNRETGTKYYREMVDRILQTPLPLPDYVRNEMANEVIDSYNFGVFGGKDIDFISMFCKEVFSFYGNADFEMQNKTNCEVGLNIFMEQIWFTVLANQHNRNVTTLVETNILDTGYSNRQFCNFGLFDHVDLLHIIGGHKKNTAICNNLNREITKWNPEIFQGILALFPEKNIRFGTKVPDTTSTFYSIERSIAIFEDFKDACLNRWQNIDNSILLRQGHTYAKSYDVFQSGRILSDLIFYRNPYLEIFAVPAMFNPKAADMLKKGYNCESEFPLDFIGLIPTLEGQGYKEIPLAAFTKEVIDAVQDGSKYIEIINAIAEKRKLRGESKDNYGKLIKTKVNLLVNKRVIFYK